VDGLCHLMAYIGDINLAGMNIRVNNMRNTEATVFASKEVLLQAITEETKYIFMNIEQHSRKSHNMDTGNESLENVLMLRHLATTSKIRIACMKT